MIDMLHTVVQCIVGYVIGVFGGGFAIAIWARSAAFGVRLGNKYFEERYCKNGEETTKAS